MDRRRERRHAVELPGSYQLGEGQARDIFFSHISSNGCRLIAEQPDLKVGDIIQLSLGPLGPTDASVRWVKDNMAGVEFRTAIDPAIVGYFTAFTDAAASRSRPG